MVLAMALMEEMTKAIHHLMVIGRAAGMKKRLKRTLDGALLSIGIHTIYLSYIHSLYSSIHSLYSSYATIL